MERVLKTITRYSMFKPGGRVGVAVSGGADSVFLLHALIELAPRWECKLCVLHLDHGLRGAESRRDAQFVRDLTERCRLPAQMAECDVARLKRETGDNLEQAARQARLKFFAEVRERENLDRIATGHTRSDQAETVLYRFLRGAGTAGLAAIRPVTPDGLVRPLIEIERAEIETYLRERGITWREDSSNTNLEFARNRIRHELLPELIRDWNPALVENLSHTAQWAQDEEAYWESEINGFAAQLLKVKASVVGRPMGPRPAIGWPLPGEDESDRFEQAGQWPAAAPWAAPQQQCPKQHEVFLCAPDLCALPRAVARRLLRRAIEHAKGDLRGLSFQHVERILEMAKAPEGHDRMQAPGLDVFRSFEWIRLAPAGGPSERNFRLPVSVPGRFVLPDSSSTIALELTANPGYDENVSGLDWERLKGGLELRNWRPGDQYRPIGRASEEKIKVLFQEARIPLWDRRNWPILAIQKDIVWARRFGPAVDYAATRASSMVVKVWEEHE